MDFNTKLVKDLVKGSAEIDRMRREIDSVVKMVSGLFDPDEMKKKLSDGEDLELFSSDSSRWELRRDLDSRYLIRVFLKTDGGFLTTPKGRLVNSTEDVFNPRVIPATAVAMFHQELPKFLWVMGELNPSLEKKLKPFIDASWAK